MSRRKKLIMVAVAGSVFVAFAFLLLSPPKSSFISSIPYLAHRKPVRQREAILSITVDGSGAKKMLITTFEIDEPYPQVHEALKIDLKHRASSASSNPATNPAMSGFSFGNNGSWTDKIVSGNAVRPGKSVVQVTEFRSLNYFDRARLWLQNLWSKEPNPASEGR